MARTCVITGASRGIGLAIAQRFAAANYDLVIAARKSGPLSEAAEALRAGGAEIEALPVDIATPRGARELIDVALDRFGRLDVLVNNAGIAPLCPIEQMSDEDFEAVMRINTAGVFYPTRAAFAAMRAGGGGTIVNISSLASINPYPGFAVYGATKAWVNLFTKAIAGEGKPHGIRVYSIAPGAVETPLLRSLFPDFPAEQAIAPDEVAAAVAAVCEPPWQRASGQTVFLGN